MGDAAEEADYRHFRRRGLLGRWRRRWRRLKTQPEAKRPVFAPRAAEAPLEGPVTVDERGDRAPSLAAGDERGDDDTRAAVKLGDVDGAARDCDEDDRPARPSLHQVVQARVVGPVHGHRRSGSVADSLGVRVFRDDGDGHVARVGVPPLREGNARLAACPAGSGAEAVVDVRAQPLIPRRPLPGQRPAAHLPAERTTATARDKHRGGR
mmetsp:Transcript_41331/g.127387  ORF Transcript_41331/g.127387 Transcript_41331/m.127387 type:complete len:209 (-) Transcript_41331:1317-1943(-)